MNIRLQELPRSSVLTADCHKIYTQLLTLISFTATCWMS